MPGTDGRSLTGLSEILFETRAGTPPIEITAHEHPGMGFRVTASGFDLTRTYQMTRSADLQDGFPAVVDGPRLPTAETDTFMDLSPPPEKAFYRIESNP